MVNRTRRPDHDASLGAREFVPVKLPKPPETCSPTETAGLPYRKSSPAVSKKSVVLRPTSKTGLALPIKWQHIYVIIYKLLVLLQTDVNKK